MWGERDVYGSKHLRKSSMRVEGMQFRCDAARRLALVWPGQCAAVFRRASPLKKNARYGTQENHSRIQCSADSDFHGDPVEFSRVFVSWPARLAAAKCPGASSPPKMGQKRPANESEGKSAKAAKPGALVNPLRWRSVKDGDLGNGPVLYWCVPVCSSSPELVYW